MKSNLPYNVMRHNNWETAPRDPLTLFNFATTTLGFGTVGAVIFAGVSTIAISVATSWIISALMPQAGFSSFGSRGTLVNAREATAAADFVYGQVRKGGVVTYYESTGDNNQFLHQIISLAGHEVEEIGDIYIDDQIVTINSGGFVTGDTWNSKIRIEKFDGSQTAASVDLLNESELTGDNALTSNFVGHDIAYLYVRYEYDADVFASGVPLVTAVVKGKKVYDPRTQTTAYSNNAALCMRDFITSEYGLNDSAIDDVVFSAAANECDEDVTLDAGGTEKRYTINGIIKASSSIGDVLGQMSTACAGTLFWGSGYWKLKVGAYSAPVKTLTLDDLRGPISLSTRSSLRDSFNGVTGTFNDAASDFITADYPSIKSATFKTEDGNDELLLDLPLPFTTSAATAQRLAKLTLYRAREQMSLSADFGLEAFNVEVGDIIAFTNERYGFDEKQFEVTGWKFASNQDAGDLRVTLTLQETSASAFSWSAEEQDIISNNTVLPVFNSVSLPTNLTLTAQAPINGDGTASGSIEVSWDASADAFVDYYEVQHKIAADAVYSGATTSLTSHSIAPTISTTLYDVRVRGVSGIGVKSDWVEAQITSAADQVAPAIPTVVQATSGYRQNIVNWTNPSDLDFSFVQVYAHTSNNSGSAGIIGTIKGTEFVHAGLTEQATRYYWVKSVDTSGNVSGFSAVASATTLADPTSGAAGDTIVTGRVFYQVLQASQPSTPSATSYNTSTGTFSGLTSNWLQVQPSVDITDTSVQEWSSQFQVTIDGTTSAQTISFTAPSGAIQVSADIESDNYVAGTSGWKIERDTGNAEFQDATIRGTLVADDITTGTLNASRINLTGSQLESSSGSLVVSDGGIDTLAVAAGAISGFNTSFTISGNVSYVVGAGSAVASVSASADNGDKFLGIVTVSYYANSSSNVSAINQHAFLNGAGMSLLFHADKPSSAYHGGSTLAGVFTYTGASGGTATLTYNPSQNYDSNTTVVAKDIKMTLMRLKR
jgi:hypothetical protein